MESSTPIVTIQIQADHKGNVTVVETVPCLHPDCDAQYHKTQFTGQPAACKFMAEWSRLFLHQAPPQGNG